MLSSYLAAVATLALLTLAPGPDVALVTRFALTGDRAAGIRAACGVVGGLAVWGVLTVVGLATLLAASAEAYAIVRVAGAVFLVGMGLRVLWRTRRGGPVHGDGPRGAGGRPVRSGFLTNVLNPKIAVFYTSLLPSLVPPGSAARIWLPVLVGTHAVLSFVWLTGYSAALVRSRLATTGPRGRAVLERITGCVLVGLGLRVAAGAR